MGLTGKGWVAAHRKALVAAAVGAVTTATYYYGPGNTWVVLGGAVLATLGVHAVPNKKGP